MKSIRIIVIMVSVAFMVAGCEMFGLNGENGKNGEDDGELTVSISDATEVNGSVLQVAVFESEDATGEEDVIAYGKPEIKEGAAEVTVKDYNEDTNEIWMGNGGETYYVQILIIDESGEEPDYTHKYEPYPYKYTQDGNEVLETDFSDYETIEN